jgi:hypothetical protein
MLRSHTVNLSVFQTLPKQVAILLPAYLRNSLHIGIPWLNHGVHKVEEMWSHFGRDLEISFLAGFVHLVKANCAANPS